MKLVLYHRPGTRSEVTLSVLQRCGLPHQVVRVEDVDDPAFRSISPLGMVPVLVVDEVPVLETVAQLLFLADLCPELLPARGSLSRARAYEWLRLGDAWEPLMIRILRSPDRALTHRAKQVLALMCDKLVGPYCTGEDWTVADDLMRWKLGILGSAGMLDEEPKLLAYAERVGRLEHPVER